MALFPKPSIGAPKNMLLLLLTLYSIITSLLFHVLIIINVCWRRNKRLSSMSERQSECLWERQRKKERERESKVFSHRDYRFICNEKRIQCTFCIRYPFHKIWHFTLIHLDSCIGKSLFSIILWKQSWIYY